MLEYNFISTMISQQYVNLLISERCILHLVYILLGGGK